jgi:acyl-CoA thioester hydrolase
MAVPFTHAVEVRFRDCDAMGHVNHAVYFTYMEQARFAFLQDRFSGELSGFGMIVVRAECDFRAQVRFGDRLAVRVRVAGLGRSSFRLSYEITNVTDGRVVASGGTVQVIFDYSTQQSVAISDSLRARLEADTSRP